MAFLSKFESGVVLADRYRTISPLNHGSFGMVFMAEDLVTKETVALKCLTKKSALMGDNAPDFAVDELSQELEIHQRLGSHPNIVNLMDSFETDTHHYLVLEFCQGGDLYEAIRGGYGPLETEHVRKFMLQLIDAVEYMHSRGIYHRDIKPENIFLTQSGSMKLGDFGLATTEQWSLEIAVGSDRYMSPEQYEPDNTGYSPAQADIWAVGICLLNILFSRNPFTIPTVEDPVYLDFSRDKQSLFDVFPTMSQDTYEVIVHCMNLDPKKRSLVVAREALLRAVSFTTLFEDMDEFSVAERPTMPTSNREPLRTPSLRMAHLDQDSFPWTKALQSTARNLSAIPDSYDEDLFAKSVESRDWCSSMAGASSLGTSIHSSLRVSEPSRRMEESVMPSSAPMQASKPIPMSSMSLVFNKEELSKSWSDMYDEDEEEFSRSLQALNSRTWSNDSTTKAVDSADAPAISQPLANDKSSVMTASLAKADVDGEFVADGFFWHGSPDGKSQRQRRGQEYSTPPRFTPAKANSSLDKWAALGERRRAYGAASEHKKPESVFGGKARRGGVSPTSYGNLNSLRNWTKDRVPMKECSWNSKGGDWNWRRDRRHHLSDSEWVGGWQGVHA